MGLLFSFAPIYIQTTLPWITYTSEVLCLWCLGLSYYYIYNLYPDMPKNLDTLTLLCPLLTTLFYIASKSKDKPFSDPSFQIGLRGASFLCLLTTLALIIKRLPHFIDFYSRNKGKVRNFFTAKHTLALILSTLALGTALFQLLQVLLQIFHI